MLADPSAVMCTQQVKAHSGLAIGMFDLSHSCIACMTACNSREEQSSGEALHALMQHDCGQKQDLDDVSEQRVEGQASFGVVGQRLLLNVRAPIKML